MRSGRSSRRSSHDAGRKSATGFRSPAAGHADCRIDGDHDYFWVLCAQSGAVFPVLSSRVRFLDRISAGKFGDSDAESFDGRGLGIADPAAARSRDANFPGDSDSLHSFIVRTEDALPVDEAGSCYWRCHFASEGVLSESVVFPDARGDLFRDLVRAELFPEQMVGGAGPHGRSGAREAAGRIERAGIDFLRVDGDVCID